LQKIYHRNAVHWFPGILQGHIERALTTENVNGSVAAQR